MAKGGGALQSAKRVGEEAQRSWPVRVVVKFGQDRGTNLAVLIAWNFLQTLIPIILILLTVGGFILGLLGMDATRIHDLVFQLVPSGHDTKEALAGAINGVRKRTGVFAILALLSFVFSASNLFGCFEQVMGDAYGIGVRPFIKQKLVALGLMVLFCVLVVIAVGGTTLTAFVRTLQVPFVPQWIEHGASGPLLAAVVGVISGVILFFVLFWLVPKRRPRAVHALPGAIFSGVLFYVLTLVFPLYLQLNKGINQYGSQFAFLFTLLFFFYFLGLITVFGIELNTVLFPFPPEEKEAAASPSPRPISQRLPRPLFAVLGGVAALTLASLAAVRSSNRDGRTSR